MVENIIIFYYYISTYIPENPVVIIMFILFYLFNPRVDTCSSFNNSLTIAAVLFIRDLLNELRFKIECTRGLNK